MFNQHFSAILPGCFYAEDVYAANLSAARAVLRRRHGLTRLPRGTQVWAAEPASSWRGGNTTSADSPYSAASGM